MTLRLSRLLPLLLFLVLPGLAWAEVGYVANLQISVRRGPGIEYKIISFLDPGAEVEVIEEESGWAKVRFGEGKVGYVLSRFLTETPTLSHQAAQVKAEAERLAQRLAELNAANQALHQERERLLGRRAELISSSETDAPASAAQLKEAISLAERVLADEAAAIKEIEAEKAFEGERMVWFLFGSAAAAAGLFLGFLTGLIGRRPGI